MATAAAPFQVPPGHGVIEMRFHMCRPGRVAPRTWVNGREVLVGTEPVQRLLVPAGTVQVECKDSLLGAPPRVLLTLAQGQVVPVFYVDTCFKRNLPGRLTLDANEVPSMPSRKLLWSLVLGSVGLGLALMALKALLGWLART